MHPIPNAMRGNKRCKQEARVGAVAGARCGRQISVLGGALAHPRAQIVGQHLGVYVYQQRMLSQAPRRIPNGCDV